jgi:methionine-rich copper-binding protein CopC
MQLPLSAFAHSELETAQPAEGEKVTTDLEVINLTFSTKIESLSTMKLKNGNQEIPLQMSIEDNQMTGKMTKPLDNGTYTVEYRIIGADSHVIEGNYDFSVDRPIVSKPDEKAAEQPKVQEKNKTTQHKHEEHKKNPSYFAPLTILLILVIALGSFFMFRKKK